MTEKGASRTPRQAVIEAALGSVYARDGKTRGTMVESLARDLDLRWEALAERAERYGPDSRCDHQHEVMQAIWMWFPGGGTAEIAAERVMRAVVASGDSPPGEPK